MTLPRLTPAEARLLRICSSYGETWDWGDVQMLLFDGAPAALQRAAFMRRGEALIAKGVISGPPNDAYGEITELGLTWLDTGGR